MAVITPSALISEIRGSVGDQTFSRNRSGAYVKAKLVQTNPDTPEQQAVRQAMADAVEEWQTASQDYQNAWASFVNQELVSKSIGRKIRRAAYNEFISRCMNRFALSAVGVGFNPLPKVRLFPVITSITQAAANITIHFDTLLAIGNCDLIVYASPPVSPGINQLNPSLLRIIGIITPAAQISSANIFAAYDAMYNLQPSDVGKKICLALKAVNTDNYAAGQFFFVQTIISAGTVSNPTPSIIQFKQATAGPGSPISVTLDSAPTDGNLLLILFQGNRPDLRAKPNASWTDSTLYHEIRTSFKIAASDPATISLVGTGGTCGITVIEITDFNPTTPLTQEIASTSTSENPNRSPIPPVNIPASTLTLLNWSRISQHTVTALSAPFLPFSSVAPNFRAYAPFNIATPNVEALISRSGPGTADSIFTIITNN